LSPLLKHYRALDGRSALCLNEDGERRASETGDFPVALYLRSDVSAGWRPNKVPALRKRCICHEDYGEYQRYHGKNDLTLRCENSFHDPLPSTRLSVPYMIGTVTAITMTQAA